MIAPQQQLNAPSRRRTRFSGLAIGVAAAALAFAASLAAVALAASGTVTIGSASNATLGERVTINAQGRTIYTLSGEAASHLKCKSEECFKFWPPVTVGSASTKLKDGAGIHGRLGILHRSNGMLQVTLRGLPLYRFAKDHARGQANGQGIESFGGTWHALRASSVSSPAPTPAPMPETQTAPTTPPMTPGY